MSAAFSPIMIEASATRMPNRSPRHAIPQLTGTFAGLLR
jgi:hypothetical protein